MLKFLFYLFYLLFYFYRNMVDVQYYVSFKCTTRWFDIYIHYEMVTAVSLITISPHTKRILNIFFMLYYIPMAYLFYDCKFVPLNPLHLLTQSPTLLLSGSHPFLLSKSLCSFYFVCLFCFLGPTYSEIIWYLSFSVWLILLSMIPSRSIHVVANDKI